MTNELKNRIKICNFALEELFPPMTNAEYHTPVLLRESVDGLNICEGGGVWLDVTFGGGGHSREILRRLDSVGGGRLFGMDQDADAEKNAIDDERFTFIRSNFRYLHNWMRYYRVEHIDGLLADLGLSSHHVDTPERGFSFRHDAPLDMRMNQNAGRSAQDVVNTLSEEALAELFQVYGEVFAARHIAAAIVRERTHKPIETTGELLRIVQPYCMGPQKKELSKIFQALRIEVNSEMEVLGEMLSTATRLLRKGGRLVVVTYHSLEDRMVKNVMRQGELRPVNRHVITPSQEETERNPRARSAKLRIAEKL